MNTKYSPASKSLCARPLNLMRIPCAPRISRMRLNPKMFRRQCSNLNTTEHDLFTHPRYDPLKSFGLQSVRITQIREGFFSVLSVRSCSKSLVAARRVVSFWSLSRIRHSTFGVQRSMLSALPSSILHLPSSMLRFAAFRSRRSFLSHRAFQTNFKNKYKKHTSSLYQQSRLPPANN